MKDFHKIGIALLLVLIPTVGLPLLAVPLIAPAAAQEVAWQKYCAENGRNVLLLVDITTPYDVQDKTILVDGLQKIVSGLNGGDRIVIRTIADSASASERLIDKCIPYCPEVGFWEELFSNCTGGLILNHKRILIAEIRSKARAKLDNFRELEHSDVIATISSASVEELSSNKQSEVYVFSDLIENSLFIPGKSFLSLPNQELEQQVIAAKLVPRLKGASVRVFGVGRGGTAERTPLAISVLNKVMGFWEQLFKSAGATQVLISQNLIVQ
jgi:hypothetical protein